MSILLAKKNISMENGCCDSIEEMAKSKLPEFMKARIGKGKLVASEIAARGGLTNSYVSDLKNSNKDGQSMSVEAVVRLAKGMKEPPVLVFKACIGQLTSGLDDNLEQILTDFSNLDPKQKENFAFMIEQIKRMLREYSDSSS